LRCLAAMVEITGSAKMPQFLPFRNLATATTLETIKPPSGLQDSVRIPRSS
jgi:hypothetical protein